MKQNAEAYYKAYLQFQSYAEVGRRFGVSRTYVRQVLLRAGYDMPRRATNENKSRSFSIGQDVSDLLDRLVNKTGSTASFHVREALRHYIENGLYEANNV